MIPQINTVRTREIDPQLFCYLRLYEYYILFGCRSKRKRDPNSQQNESHIEDVVAQIKSLNLGHDRDIIFIEDFEWLVSELQRYKTTRIPINKFLP